MLKWTKQKPTKEGWYWQRNYRKEVSITYVRKYGGTMCIMNWSIPKDSEWAGPLEEPTNEM